MEFKDLQVFQMVAKKGTMTGAAKELNYVQSNVTARIQKLEAELNTPLFNRHNRGMILTPEGKKLLLYSEKILSLANEAKKIIRDSEEPSGKLEIGSVETVIKLPIILSAYNKKYTHVDLSLVTGVTEQLQEEVLNCRLDGAFVTEAGRHPDLVHHSVFQEELVLISDLTPTSFEQLKSKPFLCFSRGCGYRAKLEDWFKDEKITPKKIMEFGTLETILGSVVAGLGITFVPKSSVSYLEEKGLIQCHSIPEKYSKINTIFIRRADTYLTSTVEKFIETIDFCKEETDYPLSFV
ncbi:LysR family transcriptional regulator [Domibacillus aminovorans]|uniref:LysR family transcriptional regulator n=1 Tax=Domibacillus aminovorans TaxID=29332 RepID=A0A177L3B2_9BACI|nr:LysR family transcriptional regulator [Domibacillus aminovorans]OAH60180.1 LysR family transcriptional regulator [Domibacillus aminovorans]